MMVEWRPKHVLANKWQRKDIVLLVQLLVSSLTTLYFIVDAYIQKTVSLQNVGATAADRPRELPATRTCSSTGILQIPQVRYAPGAPASSCLSARKPATYHETTQSPTAPHSTLLLPEDTSRSHRLSSTKHVQFPDDAGHSTQTSEGRTSPTSKCGVLHFCVTATL